MIERRRDEGCLRGLVWALRTDRSFDAQGLVEHFRERAEHVFEVAEEDWAGTKVWRLTAPYEFELRLGTRANEVTMIHRLTAPPACRDENLEWVESELRSFLAA